MDTNDLAVSVVDFLQNKCINIPKDGEIEEKAYKEVDIFQQIRELFKISFENDKFVMIDTRDFGGEIALINTVAVDSIHLIALGNGDHMIRIFLKGKHIVVIGIKKEYDIAMSIIKCIVTRAEEYDNYIKTRSYNEMEGRRQ